MRIWKKSVPNVEKNWFFVLPEKVRTLENSFTVVVAFQSADILKIYLNQEVPKDDSRLEINGC